MYKVFWSNGLDGELDGEVVSLNPGTGSNFSALFQVLCWQTQCLGPSALMTNTLFMLQVCGH